MCGAGHLSRPRGLRRGHATGMPSFMTTTTSPQRDIWVMWIISGTQIQWQQMPTPSGGPCSGSPCASAGLARHTAIWDVTANTPGYSSYDRMIIGGGYTGTAASNQAWAIDSVFSQWTALPSQSTALAGQTALYYPGDIWALSPELYDPATGLWTDLNTPK